MISYAKLLSTAIAVASALAFANTSLADSVLTGTKRASAETLPEFAMADEAVVGKFNPRAMTGSQMSLALPDGRVITAHRQRTVQDAGRDARSWVGTFPEEPGSLVVVTTYKGVATGFASYGTETWELTPGKGGNHLLYRVDDARLPPLEPEAADGVTTAEDVPGVVSDYGADSTTTAATSGYVHDVLIVYTPAARTKYGRTTLESMILNAVAAANQAYQNSRVKITLHLVGLQEVTYTETSSFKTMYYDLHDKGDGKIDSVHTLRDKVGADVVSMVTGGGDGCGIAGRLTSLSSTAASNAFNVVRASCLSQHSLAHEVGHNQGNMHDRANTTDTGIYPYAYGFRRCVTDGTGFRTVMSYPCSGAKRVAWFSNPNVTYNGYATGIAYETSPSKSADNSRSMNNTASTVASFRAAKVASTTSAPATLSATSTDYDGVSVTWTDTSSTELGFKLERSSNGVEFVEIATLGANASGYLDNDVVAGEKLYYRVRAFNGLGNSVYSNVGVISMPTGRSR